MLGGIMLSESCPRCRGYMNANRDQYGNYKECLQCGYMVDFEIQKHSKHPSISIARAKIA